MAFETGQHRRSRNPQEQRVEGIVPPPLPLDRIPVTMPSGDGTKYRTPSQSPFPVFVLCQPLFVDNKIKNNAWMKAMSPKDMEIDIERFMGEWYNLVKLLSGASLVYLIPPKKGLQDQTYVNCFAYLPHIKNKDVCIISNFTGEGRAGESPAVKAFLDSLGYTTVNSPHKFEGEPELKYLRDNIYFGGYGFRTDPKAYIWLEETYGCKIIKIKEVDEHLYHLDCSLFVLDPQNVICCVEAFDPAVVKQIEKVATIHPVTKVDCHENACNNIRVGDMLLSSSSLQYLTKHDSDYKKEWHKNERLQEICGKLGIEILFTEMKEAAKSGAAMSCFVGHLNYRY